MPYRRAAQRAVAAAAIASLGALGCGARSTASGSGGSAVSGTGGVGAAGGGDALGGMGGAGGAPVVGTGGAAVVVPEGCTGGATFDYLIRGLVAAERTAADVAFHGFDLDGRVSDGTMPEDCGQTDRVAPDGRAGIDNVVGGLWTEDFSVAFKRSYDLGTAPMLVRLRGVDSFDQDDCVDIEWFRGWATGPVALDAAGGLAPGQRFQQTAMAGRIQNARIDGGRVSATGEIPVQIAASYRGTEGEQQGFTFPITVLRIAFAASGEALTAGELGGRMQSADVHAAYKSAYPFLVSPEQVSMILFPDLPSNGAPCGLLSIGFGFDAVSANVIP